MPFLAFIGQIGVIATAVFAFIGNFAVTIILKLPTIGIQTWVLVLMGTIRVAWIASLLSFLTWIYNRLDFVINMLNDFSVGDSFVSLIFDVMNAIGFIPAFNDSLPAFRVVFFSFGVLFITKYSYYLVKDFGEQIWRISMLALE